MTATGMLIFGYDLGGPGDKLGWKAPTAAHGGPDLDWYNPDDPDEIGFGEQAAAHLLTIKGETPTRKGDDHDLAEDLWGVHLVRYGSDAQERWLLVSYRTDVSDQQAAQPVDLAELITHESKATTRLRTALDALGMPEPAKPQWYQAAHEL
ncbi:hypothetical protein ABZ897_53855 [Nonomuraea sp. NPDC046802]|uniref:hypothetical protein n=1 Tax=Nonomuraea sp. NPDC046802 TaxID=3154919 RepID=UPI0033FE117C